MKMAAVWRAHSLQQKQRKVALLLYLQHKPKSLLYDIHRNAHQNQNCAKIRSEAVQIVAEIQRLKKKKAEKKESTMFFSQLALISRHPPTVLIVSSFFSL